MFREGPNGTKGGQYSNLSAITQQGRTGPWSRMKAVTLHPPGNKAPAGLVPERTHHTRVKPGLQDFRHDLLAHLHHGRFCSFAHGQVEISCTFPTSDMKKKKKKG